MKKKIIVGILVALACLPVVNTFALSDAQKATLAGEAKTINESLHLVQYSDLKVRDHLGGYYENILNAYMIPLNSRLVANSISNPALIDNQANFKTAKEKFSDDFVVYEKKLDALLDVDIAKHPEDFYAQLVELRASREKVRQDIEQLHKLIDEHRYLVNTLKESL